MQKPEPSYFETFPVFSDQVTAISLKYCRSPSMQPWSQQSPTNKSPASNAKQGNHEKLREYETRRRLAYSSKHDSMALYWKSYCDLLSASLQETGRAKRLVLGTCRAHQLYSNAMQAMYDDTFLDEKGNVANDKQQKRLASVRRKPKMWTKGGESDVKSSSAVSEIREAQHVMAQKFGENAKNMDEEIAEAISSLLDLLQRQCSYIENVGSNILNELQKTEEEVTQAWGKS